MKAAERKVYAAVAKRADGHCEACGRHCLPEDGHRDHFRGRARSGTTVEAVWLLCASPCDADKTVNRPTAAHWLRVWRRHCERYGYEHEAYLASIRLEALAAKGFA